jgi:hypothetical protein
VKRAAGFVTPGFDGLGDLDPFKLGDSQCGRASLFIVGRERAKLGYFWRHAYQIPRSGSYLGCVVNAETGKPVIVDESRLGKRLDFFRRPLLHFGAEKAA